MIRTILEDNMNRSLLSLATILLVFTFVLAGCAPQATQAPQKPTETQQPEEPAASTGEPIPVGIISNLTGPETSSGVDMVRGVELAIEELNKTGGVNGRPLQGITEDAEYRPEKGVEAAHKLIDVNKVPVVLNVGGSGLMLPVGEYAQTQGVTLINTGASSPKLREITTLCSVVPLDDIVGKVLGEWAYNESYRSAVTVVPNNPYGIGVQDNAAIGFEDMGGKVVGKIAYIEAQADYRPEVQQIQNFAPDVILSASYGDDANLFLKQTHEAGLDMPWYVTYPTIINVHDAESANNRLFGLEPGWDLPEAQNFMNNIYGAKFEGPPKTPWANYAYDGMMLVGLAMQQCGENVTGECIYQKMPEVAKTYQGVTGSIEFDEDCQRNNAPLVQMVYKDGELQLIK